MALTGRFKDTVKARVEQMLAGDMATDKAPLRDYFNVAGR